MACCVRLPGVSGSSTRDPVVQEWPILRELAVCGAGAPGGGLGTPQRVDLQECLNQLLRTPLHSCHVAAGGRMVDFGGYELPVQYSGVLAEHRAVRTKAGLFDVSHMGEIWVTGSGALELLQRLTPNDVSKLVPGRAHYSALLTEQGTFRDDLLVYCVSSTEYLLVVNAAFAAEDFEWLLKQRPDTGDVDVVDRSEATALLALQGPLAERILSSLFEDQPETREGIRGLRYYGFGNWPHPVHGPILVSRTGYTGEDGFELYVAAEKAEGLWQDLIAVGEASGLQPAGLGARDTLRLEAGMLLSGQDIDQSISPIEAGLGWMVKFKKGDFIGRDALVAQRRPESVHQSVVGFRLSGRAIARTGHEVESTAGLVGRVTSGSFSPTLEAPIGLARFPESGVEPGQEVVARVRGKELPGTVVELPFYRRERATP